MLLVRRGSLTPSKGKSYIIHIRGGDLIFKTRKIAKDTSIIELDNALKFIDNFAIDIGCHPIGKGWIKITCDEAEKLMLHLLTKDLAYQYEIMTITNAFQIWSKYRAIINEPIHYFTNRKMFDPACIYKPYYKLSEDATFDVGLITLSTEQLTWLCFLDED
jgi:hypothetical protein